MDTETNKGSQINVSEIVNGAAAETGAQAGGAPENVAPGTNPGSSGVPPLGAHPIGSPAARQFVEKVLQAGGVFYIEACLRKAEAEGVDVGQVRAKIMPLLPAGEERAHIVETGARCIDKRIDLSGLSDEAQLAIALSLVGLNCSLGYADIKGVGKPAHEPTTH